MDTFITGKLYWFLKNQSIVRILIFLVCEWTVDAIAIRIRHNCCLTRMMREFNCFSFYGIHPPVPVLSLMTKTFYFFLKELHLFYSLFCEFNIIFILPGRSSKPPGHTSSDRIFSENTGQVQQCLCFAGTH